jgi:hypothetical protein
MKYRVTIMKTKTVEKQFENDNGKRNMFLNITKPFSNSNFENLTDSEKKRFVKGFLKTVSRINLRSSVELEKKERIIINPDGEYGLDNAVYDKETKLPSHLVDKKQGKTVRGVLGG